MNTSNKLHPCSIEQYKRFRLRGLSGAIIGVGSAADMDRMTNGGMVGTVERFEP